MSSVQVSVVIPVYRSQATLRMLATRLLRALEVTGLSHELVFVEDGGGDGSWSLLSDIQAAEPDRVVIIQLMRNYGQHNALMCGFRQAKGDYIITLDDDLQNPPEEVPKLLDKIGTGEFDLVYGIYSSKRHSSWRNAGSAFVNAFYRFTFQNNVTITSGCLPGIPSGSARSRLNITPEPQDVPDTTWPSCSCFLSISSRTSRCGLSGSSPGLVWRSPPSGSRWFFSISSSSFALKSACRDTPPPSSRSWSSGAHNCSPWA
jgi:glycosyltransferase involved in cell wall biosynthesis